MTTPITAETAAKHTPLLACCRVPSPLGTLTLAATAAGLAGVWFDDQKHHPGELHAPEQPGQRWLTLAAAELQRYFGGQLQQFTVPLDPQGTAFQQQVWQALSLIGYGHLSTYGQLARQLGRPAAARAVGAAVGRNPLGIIVPCHRVLGQDGTLTGYAGGLQRKEALLKLEGAAVQQTLELTA
jgi:methylated-DNA-[protein]-cysteine S-methyltransferase